jgi:hypothetical protein
VQIIYFSYCCGYQYVYCVQRCPTTLWTTRWVSYKKKLGSFSILFWWVCVALRFIFLYNIVLFCFVGLHPVSCVPKDASASGLSILDFHFGFLYSVYCRVKLLLFAIGYFILLQTQPSNPLKIVFHNCCCVVPNTKRTPFGIKLLIAIFGW